MRASKEFLKRGEMTNTQSIKHLNNPSTLLLSEDQMQTINQYMDPQTINFSKEDMSLTKTNFIKKEDYGLE